MNEKLTIFISLFKGREDIYATRWEKGNKNGYSPATIFTGTTVIMGKSIVSR